MVGVSGGKMSSEITQTEWDEKFETTAKLIKNMGGLDHFTLDNICGDGAIVKSFTLTKSDKLDTIEAGAQPNIGVIYSSTEKGKLANIESAACKDQTPAEIKTAYEGLSEAKVNNLTTNYLPMEIYNGEKPTPSVNDLCVVGANLKRWTGTTWEIVRLSVENV